jgi:two-component system chemotaxis sensor kinase CheA
VPLDVVDECVELSTDSSVGENDYLDLRGVVIPILRLRQQFRVDAPLSRRQNVVVIRWGTKRLGLVVDTLHGKLQAVIKPLSRVLSALPGVTGSTILGDGTVALILDIAALAAQVEHRPRIPVSPSFQSPRSLEELHQ